MKKTNRFTLVRLLISLAVIVVSFAFCYSLLQVSKFYKSLDAYSGAVSRGDQLAVRDNLEDLRHFPDLNKKLEFAGLDFIANKYLFKDFRYYESAYDYMTGNYERVIDQLKDDEDFYAHFIRANAKWRTAQGLIEQNLSSSTIRIEPALKSVQMAAALKEDYAECIKKDQKSSISPKWNYDLVTDPNALARGLMPKPQKVRVVLGRGGKNKKGEGQDKGEGPKGHDLKDGKESPEQPGKPKSGTYRPG